MILADRRGFTLCETVVAATIIAIGVVGVAVMAPLSSYGIREGKQLSTAVFLAEQRMEQVRSARWSLVTNGIAHDCVGLSAGAASPPVTSACPALGSGAATFPDEDAGSLPVPFDSYRRVVRVTTCGAPGVCPVESADLRLVTVTVRYVPISGVGGNATGTTKPVVLHWLLVKSV